jgi:23S rRNA (pseudouridine1915-N3)-methyltransferase
MRILIVAVGKLKQAGLRTELDDYLSRIRRYAPCQEIELKDGSERELGERFARAIPARSLVVALEVEGRAHDSPGLARFIAKCEQSGVAHLVFLVGGAYGLPAPVSRAADRQLSLSQLTLPHRLARVILAEQVYRAFTILRNEPYSH